MTITKALFRCVVCVLCLFFGVFFIAASSITTSSGGGLSFTSGSGIPTANCSPVSFYLQTAEALWYCRETPNVWVKLFGGDGGPLEIEGDVETTPANPATGAGKFWFDSVGGVLASIVNPSGTPLSSNTVKPGNCSTGKAVTGIGSDGVQTCAVVGSSLKLAIPALVGNGTNCYPVWNSSAIPSCAGVGATAVAVMGNGVGPITFETVTGYITTATTVKVSVTYQWASAGTANTSYKIGCALGDTTSLSLGSATNVTIGSSATFAQLATQTVDVPSSCRTDHTPLIVQHIYPNESFTRKLLSLTIEP